MKRNNSSIAGTRKVFAFTLGQMVKAKANVITVIVLLLLSLASLPVLTLFTSESTSGGLTTVYYIAETDLSVSAELLTRQETYRNVTVQPADFGADEWTDYIDEDSAFLRFYGTDGSYGVEVCLLSEGMKASALSAAAQGLLTQARAQAAGLDSSVLEQLSGGFRVETGTYQEYAGRQTLDFDTGFGVQLIYSILVMMLTLFSASFIIRAVIEEKSSKLVDLLLVSVRPLALILGKVLAVMVYIFGLLAAFFAALAVSAGLTEVLLGPGRLSAALAATGLNLSGLNLGLPLAVGVIGSLLISYVTFSALSALAGVSCSSMEEMEGANVKVVLLIMVGYMAACFVGGAGDRTIGLIASFLPLISLFCAPVQYALGVIDFPTLMGAWALQCLIAFLLVRLCAAVYEGLLLHKGAPVKASTILSMAFGRAGKGGGR